jgi:hypothetical protein
MTREIKYWATVQRQSQRPFNVIVNDEISAKDIELTVRLKGVKGNHDQGAALFGDLRIKTTIMWCVPIRLKTM